MRVMIIPEDPTHDRFILKPIVEQIFRDLTRPARIEVCENPRLHGVAQALDAQTIAGIIRDYPMYDLFLLMVDRDCDRKHNGTKAAQRTAENRARLLHCLAVEEIEVWMLALHRNSLAEPWGLVRAECDPREAFARPFLEKQGWAALPGKGRKRAMRDLGTQWRGLLQVCPELNDLKACIAAWLAQGAPNPGGR